MMEKVSCIMYARAADTVAGRQDPELVEDGAAAQRLRPDGDWVKQLALADLPGVFMDVHLLPAHDLAGHVLLAALCGT